MTRLLCVGDLHIGAGPDYGREPGDRLRDQEQVWERILDVARETNVDAVLFAGDAFHRRRPTPAEYLAFLRPLQAFNAETEIPVLAIDGNHDVEASDLPSALELFGRELDLHRRPGLWHTLGGAEIAVPGGVTVATLPWAPTGRLVAQLGGGDRDDLNLGAAELLLRAARDLRASIEGPCVLMLHWSVSGASTPTGAFTDDFREVVLDVDELAAIGFDAVVCGHIHKAQSFSSFDGWYQPGEHSDVSLPFFYTGSPMPVDFGEASTPHGVWLVELDDAPVARAEFLPIESRPFVTVDVDLTSAEARIEITAPDDGYDRRVDVDETDYIVAMLMEAAPLADAVVRVRYRATEQQASRVDRGAIAKFLDDAGVHKLYAIQPDIVRENRARVDHVDDDLTPADAVAMYGAANGLSRDELETLDERTIHYLHEARA